MTDTQKSKLNIFLNFLWERGEFLVFIIPFLLIIPWFLIESKYGSVETYFNMPDKPCSIILPDEVKIVYNNKTLQYGIRVDGDLVIKRWDGLFSSSGTPFTFPDSCSAKIYSIHILREMEELKDHQNFK